MTQPATEPDRLTRRDLLARAGLAWAGLAAAPMLNLKRYRLSARSPAQYSERAVRLVRESTVIDMLAPLSITPQPWLADPATFTDADFEKFRGSGINVFHIATGVGGTDPYTNVLRFVAAYNGFIAHHADRVMRVSAVEHLERVNASGKLGILIGIQNADHFRTVDDIPFFLGLGQRVGQLTYNTRNRIGTGAMDRSDGGLSDFGVDVVRKMNEVGMAVDVSHCGDRTTLDAMEVSTRPVLITHSNVRALVPGYPRNKTDEAIRAMARTGGVFGVTSVRSFIRDSEPTTMEHLLDHYDHVARLVGVEHVGVGTDVDLHGYDALPAEARANLGGRYAAQYRFRERIDLEGQDHPLRMYDLTEGLIRRGWSDADIGLILGGNFKRVLAEIWTV
jgi:membrane dipeptidase